MLFTSVALLLAGASSVRAHGYVQTVNIGGKDYPGWLPFESPYGSPVPQTVERKVADDGPINFDAAELTCNKGGDTGNGATATVAAGDNVVYTMNRWPDDHHGPVTMYMADCGGDCDSFSGSGASWFKIDSQGLLNPDTFTWASDKLIADGLKWTATVPSNIKAGNYLMRLEILALHSAGAPQFYPSCTQLTVTGGGDGAPTASELVSIPGVYKQGDEALFGNIWNQPQSWPQVGPDVAAFISGAAPPPSAPAPSPSSSAAPSSISSASAEPESTSSSDPEPSATSSEAEATSTYVEPEPESTKPATTTKSVRPTRSARPTATPKSASKVCRIKSKSANHSTKRNYMRALGMKRL